MSDPDLSDDRANRARADLLATTRGYGEDRELFEHFPAGVAWAWMCLTRGELERVRYIEYSYWNEISGGSRLAADAAERINAGVEVWGVPNGRFHSAARALLAGERLGPPILAGPDRHALVCLEGHLRLTAHALAGFPLDLECLVGVSPALKRWCQ